MTASALAWQGAAIQQLRRAQAAHVGLQRLLGLRIDDGADIGIELHWIPDAQQSHRAGEQLQRRFGNVLLQAQQPQRRAALAGTLKCRDHRIANRTFQQRARIHDHRVEPAGLRRAAHL